MHSSEDDAALRRELDRCVKCGLCLPECPTYRLTADEGESPRGRLALIEGLLDGRLTGDEALRRHIDSCLTCRRCERVCPSKVPYGRLIDAARASLPGTAGRRLAGVVQKPTVQRLAAGLSRAVPTFVSRPVARIHALHRAAEALPDPRPAPAAGVYASTGGPARGRIGLFSGCTGAAWQPAALHAAMHLIRRAGFEVLVTGQHSCCGALAAHAGDAAAAQTAAARTRAVFDDGLDGIVSIASGCGIHLDSYQPPLTSAHRDVCRFLAEEGGYVSTDFETSDLKVAVHVPCSVENVYRGSRWATDLLRLLPGIELTALGTAGQCCGAAGDHMLRAPQRAAQLREPLMTELFGSDTDVLVSSNIGCALHLAAGLRGRDSPMRVMHPVELLSQQLV